jgi:hypothetical protein
MTHTRTPASGRTSLKWRCIATPARRVFDACSAYSPGERAVRDERTDAQTAVRSFFNVCKGQQPDVDETGRRLNLQFHEIEQVGAAGADRGESR